MDVLDRAYAKKLAKLYKTGNVTAEKGTTDTEYLIFTAQKGTADESKVTFSKEEVRGLGIKSIAKNSDGDTIVTLTDDTTKNLGQWNGKNVQVEVSENTPFSTKLKFKYYDNDGTAKELITENIKGGNIYSGEEVDSKDEHTVVKIIDGSRVGDLYLNTKTDVLYRRTDDNSSDYTWTKIAELKGKTGQSNYEIWLELPGNQDKSKVQYIEYMRNQFKQVKRVWDKPLLSDEGTDLNCIYYYQEGQNAWLSKLYVPDDKDFGVGKYTYFDGIRWLSFENNTQVIPSHTMKDTVYFYCIYDEKSLKCRAHSVNKQTGEDKALGNGWVDLTISDTKPDDSYELHETRLERLGRWKTTLYAGDTKADALEVTEDGTSSLDGVITTEIFNSLMGAVDLETENKTIKGAINEVNTNKANTKDLTRHTSNTNIHVTTADKTKWYNKLSRTDIATTIDENSTDKNPAGARAVYEKIKNMVTTSVPDVEKTDITSKVSNATVNYNGGVSYSVKNGICYVQFTSVTTTTATNGAYIIPKGTLPSIDNSLSNGRYPVVGGGAKSGMVSVDGNTGGVRYYGGEMTIFTTISYPVKES